MKGKRLLSLLLALSLTVALAVSNASLAFAADYNIGESYTLAEILTDGGLVPLAGNEEVTVGRYAKYRLTANQDGDTVAEDDAGYPASTLTDALDVITFETLGTYTFWVYFSADDAEEAVFTLNVVDNNAPQAYYRISGVAYGLNDFLAYLGMEALSGKTNVSDGRKVTYRLVATSGGTLIAENDPNYAEATMVTVKDDDTNDDIEFKNTGSYIVYIYNGTDDNAVLEKAATINVRKNVVAADEDYNKTSVTYKNDFTAYYDKIAEKSADLITGNSFEVPDLEDYVYSADFYYSTLQKKVYYCAPNATSYTEGSSVTTSTASFTVNYLGTYSYYVLFEDVFGNQMTTDNLVLGDGGWYKTLDNDGETQIGNVVIPVFTFTVGSVAMPAITVKASNNAYLDLTYEVETFNIVSDSYNSVYKLYYSATAFDKDGDTYANDTEYMQAVIQGSEDVTDGKEGVTEGLNTSNLTFTPEATGYYYVQVRVVDDYNNEAVAMSRAIACQGEAKTTTPEKEFLKYNATSIVFLSISGVCAIAIVLLLVIKPKESKTVEVEGSDDKAKK